MHHTERRLMPLASRSRRPAALTRGASLCVLLLALAPTSPAGQTGGWIEVRSPHFRVVSDAGEANARRVAREFEVIRSVFLAGLPSLVSEPRRPLTIVAVGNEEGLVALLPQIANRSARPVGAFLDGSFEHHIVLRVDASRRDGFRPLYHEYFHLLTSINSGRLPPWLMEGLAEVYSNAAIRGGTAEIGDARLDHLDLLANVPLLPLATLLADDTDPHQRDALGESIFYAQSWALTHLLLLGDATGDGRQVLGNYITRLQQGEDAVTAFEAAVTDLRAVRRALEAYIRRDAFYAMRMDAPPGIDESRFETRALTAAETLVARAGVLRQGGHLHLARPLVEQAVADSPENPLAHEALGLFEWSFSRYAEAGAAFAEAARLGSTSYIPYYLGALATDTGSDRVTADRQARGLRRAIELNPRFAPAYASLARLVIQYPEGETEALELARTATELEPNVPAHWVALAEVQLTANRPAEARRSAERGRAAAREDEERTLVATFLEALDGARAHYLRGNALRAQGDLQGAADAYRAAIGVAPGDAAAHNGLGVTLRVDGDLGGAIEAFREAVHLAPGDPAARHNLANALHARGAMAEAIAAYQVAIRLDPGYAATHRALGDALRDAGNRAEAIEAYRRAVELDPNDDTAKRRLAEMLPRSPR